MADETTVSISKDELGRLRSAAKDIKAVKTALKELKTNTADYDSLVKFKKSAEDKEKTFETQLAEHKTSTAAKFEDMNKAAKAADLKIDFYREVAAKKLSVGDQFIDWSKLTSKEEIPIVVDSAIAAQKEALRAIYGPEAIDALEKPPGNDASPGGSAPRPGQDGQSAPAGQTSPGTTSPPGSQAPSPGNSGSGPQILTPGPAGGPGRNAGETLPGRAEVLEAMKNRGLGDTY